MPIELHYDREIDAMVFRVTEIVGIRDLTEVLPRFMSHPEFRKNMNQLMDMSQGGIDLSIDELRSVMAVWGGERDEIGSEGFVAVATSRPVDFGQSRMYEALLDETENFHVFSGLEPARRWIQENRS